MGAPHCTPSLWQQAQSDRVRSNQQGQPVLVYREYNNNSNNNNNSVIAHLSVGAEHVLGPGVGGEEVEGVARLPHRPPLALGALTHELPVLVHLSGAEVGRLVNRGLEMAMS